MHVLKGTAIEVLKGAAFELHKWNSNVPELEADNQLTEDSQTYAKEQLGVRTNKAKLLGLPWDSVEDTLAVTFSGDSHEATKRDVLRSLASIYDPLGVASRVTLVGKMFLEKYVTDTFIRKGRESGLMSLNSHTV